MSSQTQVQQQLLEIKNEIEKIVKEKGLKTHPRLVAVSKTKPNQLIEECYQVGHRIFGENYIQELVQKSSELPSDIEWHFIGRLQRNKCKILLSVPNLSMVETVDSQKLATALEQHSKELRITPLSIMIQVNTSHEETKGGVNESELSQVVEYVLKECPHLKFAGLMTIGAPENPGFQTLSRLADQICSEFKLPRESLELSMGMSNDYLEAIIEGSTNVRVGSSIFGAREYPNKHE